MASVTVKAGGITEMTMGGTGRAVVGKALFKDSPTNFAWKDVTLSLMDNSGFKSPGTARHPGFYYHSGTVTNGGFQFEDVQPGKYNLTAQLPPRAFGHWPAHDHVAGRQQRNCRPERRSGLRAC